MTTSPVFWFAVGLPLDLRNIVHTLPLNSAATGRGPQSTYDVLPLTFCICPQWYTFPDNQS